MDDDDAKEFIDQALRETGLSLEELAERLDYKSLKRARTGEIPLPDSKRRHITDLVKLARLEREASQVLGDERSVVADDATTYDPRGHLREVREARGLSYEDLAKLSRIPAAHLRELENGSTPISQSVFERLKKALPQLRQDIIYGGADLPRTIDRTGMSGMWGDAPTITAPPGGTVHMVPLISWAQAGRFHDFGDEAFAHETIPAIDVSDRKAFALEIRGDSMEPKITEGDRVIVCPSWQPRNGDTVICRTMEGDVMCKLYQSKGAGRFVILSSHNPAYPAMELSREEIMWIYPVADVSKRLRRE